MDRGDRADWFQSAWVCYFSAIALSAFVLLIVTSGAPLIRSSR